MFVATDNEGRTVFHVAAGYYKIEMFQEILNCAKENLTREEVNKLLLATDNEGRTVFQEAVGFCEVEMFQQILNCAKENLTREEVNK